MLDAAAAFKKTHGRPPILIIDDINRLAQRHPKELEVLQDDAKDWADTKQLIIVFVSSEGNGPRLLQGRSAKSRMDICEIGDIVVDKAVDYLVSRSVPQEIAHKAVNEITGGRFHLLDQFARGWKPTKDKIVTSPTITPEARYLALRVSMITAAHNDIRAAGLRSATKENQAAIRVIEALFKAPNNRITLREFEKLVTEADVQDKLLRAQVFSFHATDGSVTFQSNVIRTSLKEDPI